MYIFMVCGCLSGNTKAALLLAPSGDLEPLQPWINPAAVRGILLGPETHQIWQSLILCLSERKLSKYIQNMIIITGNSILILNV